WGVGGCVRLLRCCWGRRGAGAVAPRRPRNYVAGGSAVSAPIVSRLESELPTGRATPGRRLSFIPSLYTRGVGSWYWIGVCAGLGVGIGVLVAGLLAGTRAALAAALIPATGCGGAVGFGLGQGEEGSGAGGGGGPAAQRR